jgi:predicted metal-dependent hydrolase
VVVLRRSARAKRLTLRVPATGGDPVLTLPRYARLSLARAFLTDREPWLRNAVSRVPDTVAVCAGVRLPVEGTMLSVQIGTGRIRIEGETLILPGPTPRVAGQAMGFLKTLARTRAIEALDHYADTLGRPFGRLTLRDTGSRWGSCTSEGNIMLSWRLVMAPPEVLDYVAAHEVAHLEHMDHSPAFWRVVKHLYPGHESPQHWLRTHGAELHRYQF